MAFWNLAAIEPGKRWIWNSVRDRDGYGIYGGRRAHRMAYAKTKGDPTGFYVCHSCDNPSCINPDHLWLGTARDNSLDSRAKGRTRGVNQTHCMNGHEFTPANTYVRTVGVSCRQCRACNTIAAKKYAARRKAAAA